jgi:hypothetical protein
MAYPRGPLENKFAACDANELREVVSVAIKRLIVFASGRYDATQISLDNSVACIY